MHQLCKKGIIAVLVLALLLALCGCGSTEKKEPDESPASILLTPEASPPAEISSCQTFGDLLWQDAALPLLESRAYTTEIVQKGYSFGGQLCSACYQFDSDGLLNIGTYRFNENGALPWEDVVLLYWELRNELISQYGLPSEATTATQGNEQKPAPSIQDVIENGSGSCLELWPQLSAEDDHTVYMTLELQSSEMICITYVFR